MRWVDTCCIDKSSSAEFCGAMNSIVTWYSSAENCYAYLVDVCAAEVFGKAFSKSLWFTDGWVVQELLATDTIPFYNRDWNLLGTKLLYDADERF